jgi:hypothetical protein
MARKLDARARARLLCAESDGADWRTAGFQVQCVFAGGNVDAYVLRMNRRPFNRAKSKDLKMVRSDDPAYLLGHSWKTREAALHPRNVRSFRYWVTDHSFRTRRLVDDAEPEPKQRRTSQGFGHRPGGSRPDRALLLREAEEQIDENESYRAADVAWRGEQIKRLQLLVNALTCATS